MLSVWEIPPCLVQKIWKSRSPGDQSLISAEFSSISFSIVEIVFHTNIPLMVTLSYKYAGHPTFSDVKPHDFLN